MELIEFPKPRTIQVQINDTEHVGSREMSQWNYSQDMKYLRSLSRFPSTLVAELRNNTMQQITVTALHVLKLDGLHLLPSKGKAVPL